MITCELFSYHLHSIRIDIAILSMHKLAAVCLLLASVAPASAQSEKVGNDTSPSGKYAISVTTADEEHYELKISNAATGEIASVFPMEDYDTETQHHAVDAVWRPDSTAFALNVERGRSITVCEIYLEAQGKWQKLAIPDSDLEKLRKKANEEGGPSRDYLNATGWKGKDTVELEYTGNKGTTYEIVCKMIAGNVPHLKVISSKLKPD